MENEYRKICTVIVTYGERGTLAEKIVLRCIDEQLSRIILIDNASSESSHKNLQTLAERYKRRVKLIRMERNIGSAGGFKRGLEEFYREKDYEYVFLLDDDNLPSAGCVEKLLRGYLKLKEKSTGPIAVFASRKKDGIFTHSEIAMIATGGKADKNSFFGFNILRLPFKVTERFSGKSQKNIIQADRKVVSVETAPYGTLFFHKSLIDLIGYPMEELYLYMDDLEYTRRILQKGGKIYLLLEASAEEITQPSWRRRKWVGGIFSYLEGESQTKIYYATRNASFYEYHILNFSSFNFCRWVNKTIYLAVTFLGAIFLKRLGDWFLILKAIKRGENNDFTSAEPNS